MALWLPDPRLESPELLYPGRKPAGNIAIDWSHPMTRGLSCLFLPSGFKAGRESLGGSLSYGVGATTEIKKGHAIKFNGVYREGFINGSSVMRTQDISVVVAVVLNGADPKLISTSRHDNYTGNSLWCSATTLVFGRQGSSPLTSAAFPSIDDGTVHLIGASRESGGALNFFLDGKKISSHSAGADGVIAASGRLGDLNGWGYSFAGWMLAYIDYGRVLSDVEMLEMTANPYQFLVPA